MASWLSALVLVASISGDQLPGVVVLPADASGASGFIDSLQIQLTGLASVTRGPLPTTESTDERAERARLALAATGASIAVWQERRTLPGSAKIQLVVLAVTRDSKRPIEVARIDGTRADDADRILALKVGELLHQVLASATSEQELAAALVRRENENQKPPPAPAPAPPVKRATAPLRLRGLLEAGVGLRADSSLATPQVDVGGALGGALQRGSLRLELALGARWLTEQEHQAENGTLAVREVSAFAELRALKLLPPFALGANAGLAANFVSASAASLDGRRGSATKLGSSWSAGSELRLSLLPALEMRTRVAVGTTLYDQRFSIEGVTVADGSDTHFSGGLSLIYWIP